MNEQSSTPLYTIDMDSLVVMFRDEGVYSKKYFGLWNKVSELISKGEIISHIEVFQEITDGNADELSIWSKSNKKIFKDYDLKNETEIIEKIAAKFPNFIQQKKQKHNADPWIVAQAKFNNLIIITQESPQGINKIPNVAKNFGVDTVDLFGLIKKNNWNFPAI